MSRISLITFTLAAAALLSPLMTRDTGAQRAQDPARGIERDMKFERLATTRYRKIGAMLQPEAKKKLAAASTELLTTLAKNSNPGDLYDLARKQVHSQFVGLSEQQSDLLSFYVLNDVAQLLTVPDDLMDKLDSMKGTSEMVMLRLQMLMDRRSKFITTLSNILKKISSTQDSVVQNLK